jgi:tellurite resistance protein TehA-like permease
MAVGPPGYTAFAFMNLARTARYAFPAAGLLDEEAARTFQAASIWYSLPLFGLALYLWITPLVLYTIGIIKIRKFKWTMAFWSLTFPSKLQDTVDQQLAFADLLGGCFLNSDGYVHG